MTFTDADFPAAPYPGRRPDVSFVHLDGVGHPMTPCGDGWQVAGELLGDWLAGHDAPPPAGRHAVLSYGSNACPSKITWLREALGLRGPVVVLRAWTDGVAAVWASGLRVVDDQRPATLAASEGPREQHAIWLATDDQLAVLDVCEGRGARYELAHVRSGSVTLETGRRVDRPLAYVGRSPARMPLLVDGLPVRCAVTPQHVARTLVGVPAPSDGLDREVLTAPSP